MSRQADRIDSLNLPLPAAGTAAFRLQRHLRLWGAAAWTAGTAAVAAWTWFATSDAAAGTAGIVDEV